MVSIATARANIASQVIDGSPNSITPSKLRVLLLDLCDALDAETPFPKFNATAAPTANDDGANSSGNGTFAVGSIWIDTAADIAYRCVDASTGAAIWINTTLSTGDLGALAVLDAVNNETWDGTDLAIANGGTGASTAATARANLGLSDLIQPVANRTALKAVDTTVTTAAYLREDEREGFFEWTTGNYSAEIAADTNEGIYVKATAVASTAGAWVRVYEDKINVRWFGAVGDGVTDDYLPFRRACDTANAIGGGNVFVPIGRYVFSAGLQLNGFQGVHIIGENRSKSVLTRNTNFTGAHIRFYLGTGNSLQNLTMDADGYAGRGVFFQDRYSWVQDCDFLDTPDRPISANGGGNDSFGLDANGLTQDGAIYNDPDNPLAFTPVFFPRECHTFNCRIIRAAQTAISYKRMIGTQIVGNYVEEVYSEAITMDVGSRNCLIDNNTCKDIALTNRNNSFPDKVNGGFLIFGSLNGGSGGTGGIGVDAAFFGRITNNTIDGVETNVAVINDRIKVAFNLVNNIAGSTNIVFTGNTIVNAKLGVWFKGTGSGAGGNSFGCVVSNNTFALTGTGAGSGSDEYGDIWIDAGCNRNKFVSNAKLGGDLLVTDNGSFNIIDTDYEVLDEDDMASNLARRPASQQSVKAYVDGRVPTSSTTFTPSLQFGGAAVGMTYGTQTGRYQRHGNLIFFQINIVLTALGSSTGSATVTNLPVAAHASAITVLNLRLTSPGGTAPAQPYGEIAGSATTIGLFNDRSLGAAVTALTEANFTATSTLIIMGYYEVA